MSTGHPRVLIAAHSHPELTKGGAEIAAWQLHCAIGENGTWASSFIGCGGQPRPGPSIGQPMGPGQYLYTPGEFDWFTFTNRNERFPEDFTALLRQLRPDVLHFHHYAQFGVEAFAIARRALPDIRLVLTLHEFQAICNHFGQMVTRPQRGLCAAASLTACHRCFPERGTVDLFLREHWLKSFFGLIDAFVAPSHFLADRYIAWGLPRERMHVIGNAIARPAEIPPRPRRSRRFQVGFFGQMSMLKGIGVLLDAAEELADDPAITINIHGDDRNQPESFREELAARLARSGHNVRLHGAYDNSRVDALMRGMDVVVMPSVWWENAPVVIEEALRNRVPVLCSDIGGMAEAVRDGLDGFHFAAGSAGELAALVRELAADPQRLAALSATMRTPPTAAEVAARHLALYHRLLPGAPTPAGASAPAPPAPMREPRAR
jgi:glycosyltransferase involved in cell wall biosynthesis